MAPPTDVELIADIDQRISYIDAQVRMGSDRDEVATEQFRQLLGAFSSIKHFPMPVSVPVSEHLANKTTLWTRDQIAAFSACL